MVNPVTEIDKTSDKNCTILVEYVGVGALCTLKMVPCKSALTRQQFSSSV